MLDCLLMRRDGLVGLGLAGGSGVVLCLDVVEDRVDRGGNLAWSLARMEVVLGSAVASALATVPAVESPARVEDLSS